MPRKDSIVIDEAAKDLLLHFRESIILPLVRTDADKWPIRSGRIGRLCLDEFSREFFEDINLLRKQQMSEQSIAALFKRPSHLWRMSHHLLNGLHLLDTPLAAQQQAILTLLKIISYLKYGEIFCRDGANIIWSPGQVIDTVNDLQPLEGQNAARLVHQLAGVLWTYAESLYFVAHELSVEIHGPYNLSNGHVLLVRDFFELQPSALLPLEDAFVSSQTIRILTVYSRFNAHLDVYNNLYVDAGTRLIDEMIFCQVLIDNRTATLTQIRQLIQEASQTIKEITTRVNSWSLEQVAQHYVHIFWWRKAALSYALQKDWKPPEKVLTRIIEKNIPDAATANPSLDALRKQYTLF